MLKELPINKAIGLFGAVFFVLCGVVITWAGFSQPSKSEPHSKSITFAEALPLSTNVIKTEPYGPFVNTQINDTDDEKPDILAAETLPLSAATNQDVLKKCASLLEQGVVCMFVNSDPAPRAPQFDSVIQDHLARRSQARQAYEAHNTSHGLSNLNTIAPSAGIYDLNDQNIFTDNDAKTFHNSNTAADDTIAQSAMRAAMEMVQSRYADAVYQAQLNDGETDFDTQQAIALSQNALSSAAERAFETFMRNNFGKRSLEGHSYEGIRGYFMTAFKHAAASSIKSVGKRVVSDITSGGDFKSLEIRSELLRRLDENIASALIDTGLAAAKNSQYAFLRNLEVSYKLRENAKPEYSILTIQPIYSSAEKKHNLFAQAALSHQGSRNGLSGGLGYRYLPKSEDYVVGSSVFVDYERPYNHLRASVGLDVQTSLLGASANYYKGLSDWKDAETGFEERPMDGFDLELAGRMPFLPALEVAGRGYRWQGIDGANDIDGTELRLEYSPVPAFTLEALLNNEDNAETSYGLGLRYNYTFGAPSEYLYDWQEQFRQKSPSEYIFSKVRRENTIRVQSRIDPDSSAATTPVGPAITTSSPINGATGVSIGTDVVLTFAADVLAGAGNIVFTDLTDASDDFTIPVGDARVGIVNNVVTIDLSAQLLDFNSNYEVSFAEGVFTDTSANDSPELAAGNYSFITVVDPTAGFGAATATIAPNSAGAAFNPRNTTSSWQTTMNITGAPNGVIFESGATGRGIAAWFHLGNLRFAAGQGNVTATGGGAIFGDFPTASIPLGLHHFVFVAKPSAAGEIGVYMDGIRVITETTAAAMASNEWAGTDGAGYGQSSGNVRDGGNTATITNATLTNNLSFFLSQQPASF